MINIVYENKLQALEEKRMVTSSNEMNLRRIL